MTHETIVDCALDWEKKAPDATYMTQPTGGGAVETYTWRQALDEARRMAAHLKSLNYPPKSHIALVSKNCAHWIIADLAIWLADHVSVPLYPTLTSDTVSKILEHSESKLLFVGKLDVWTEMKEGVPADLPRIALPLSPKNEDEGEPWKDVIGRHEPLTDVARRTRDELATIVYTSGSTGMPKGVMLSFAGMIDAARGVGTMLSVKSEDRMLSYLPLAHVMERMIVECCSLYYGFQLFFAESLETFVKDLQRARPTLFVSVPRLWLKFQLGVFKNLPEKKLRTFLKIPILSWIVRRKILKKLGLDCVRFAGSGSAPIPAALIDWYRKLGLELLEGYGMTENFAFSHVTKPGQVKPGTVGSPYPGVEHKISDQGEVLVKSPATMMGYYKLPEKTAEVIDEDGFLHTGDRGVIDEMGRLKLTGRVKELFKTSKGKYVAPAPIENKLVNHPRIELVCVGGSGHPAPHALVMLSEDARADLEKNPGLKDTISGELKEHLEAVNKTLDHHEHLQFLAVVKDAWLIENGFLTPTMKIKRAKIEDTYGGNEEAWYGAKDKLIWQE